MIQNLTKIVLITAVTFYPIWGQDVWKEKIQKIQEELRKSEAKGLNDVPSPSSEGLSLPKTVIKLAVTLAFCAILIYALAYFIKRLMRKGKLRSLRGGNIDVLETAFLGPQKIISLVRVADQILVLGSTPQQISTLTTIQGQPALDLIKGADEGLYQDGMANFSEHLNKFMDKFRKKPVSVKSFSESSS